MIKPGQPAPDFTLPSQDESPVRLADFKGKSPVVLYFYPKDETPGCTKEACAFRDQYEVFKEAGAQVLGVSADSPTSHRLFAAKYRLPFKLLSDADGTVRRLYGVTATLGLLPGRVTFVIDRTGIVRHAFSSQFHPSQHIDEALAALKTL